MKIAVASGKGGTGKTTVVTHLAFVASQEGRSVQVLDCDVEEPNGHLFLKPVFDTPRPVTTDLLEEARTQLQSYFNRRLQKFSLPLDLRGTDFQHLVWLQVLESPYGQTTTYGEIATVLGHPKASRAVGQAVGANPVSIVVPCHRVMGAGGKLIGYGGGIERKAALLELERAGLQLRIPLKWSAVRTD